MITADALREYVNTYENDIEDRIKKDIDDFLTDHTGDLIARAKRGENSCDIALSQLMDMSSSKTHNLLIKYWPIISEAFENYGFIVKCFYDFITISWSSSSDD